MYIIIMHNIWRKLKTVKTYNFTFLQTFILSKTMLLIYVQLYIVYIKLIVFCHMPHNYLLITQKYAINHNNESCNQEIM